PVSNAGPSTATGLSVSDAVPSQFTVTGVACATGTCSNTGNAVSANLSSLAKNATWTITVHTTVKTTTAGGTYTNSATVSASNDSTGGNNTANDPTNVSAQADLEVHKTASP